MFYLFKTNISTHPVKYHGKKKLRTRIFSLFQQPYRTTQLGGIEYKKTHIIRDERNRGEKQ